MEGEGYSRGAEIRKQLEDNMVGNSLLLDSRREVMS